MGIFDSGLGGLTVVRALAQELPGESLLYLGDTARVPYGTKSADTVVRYAVACGRELVARGIKALVVACNTASSVALDRLRVEFDLPVLGVVGPGARAAVALSRGGRIGVMATAGTVRSGAYSQKVAAESTRVEVFQQPAPLLVPLVEEGWTRGEVPKLCVRRYLEPLLARSVDTLILGCTHYPVLQGLIEAELSEKCSTPVPVVDTPAAVASELGRLLVERGQRQHDGESDIRLLVTDWPDAFRDLAQRFLGPAGEALQVSQIDLSRP